jgi:hypothetical protein
VCGRRVGEEGAALASGDVICLGKHSRLTVVHVDAGEGDDGDGNAGDSGDGNAGDSGAARRARFWRTVH